MIMFENDKVETWDHDGIHRPHNAKRSRMVLGFVIQKKGRVHMAAPVLLVANGFLEFYSADFIDIL